jgi:hypothetical protein
MKPIINAYLLIIFLTFYSCGPACDQPITKRFVVYYPNGTDTLTVTGCEIDLVSDRGSNKIYIRYNGHREVFSTTAIIKEIKIYK